MFLTLLGIHISTDSKIDLLQQIADYLHNLKSEKPLTIVTPNPEQIVIAQENPEFREILNSADISLPDGVGIIWALKYRGRTTEYRRQYPEDRKTDRSFPSSDLSAIRHPSSVIRHPETLPGIEFMEDLVRLAAEKGYPIALIGGWEGVAQKALDKLKEKYPGLVGWAEEPGAITIQKSKIKNQNDNSKVKNELTTSLGGTDAYFEQLAQRITDSGTKLVFVGLGAPKQELFIHQLTTHLPRRRAGNSQLTTPLIVMSIGGAFDEISGKIPRAPGWVTGLGLKWLWRLILEPWRIGRQLKLVKFVILVLKQRVSGKI